MFMSRVSEKLYKQVVSLKSLKTQKQKHDFSDKGQSHFKCSILTPKAIKL